MKRIIIAQLYETYIDEDECGVNIDEIVEDSKIEFEESILLGGLDFDKKDIITAETSMGIVADGIHYIKRC